VPALCEPLCDHFLRPQHLVAPEKAAFHPHDDLAILFRKVRRLEADHPVNSPIDHLLRLDSLTSIRCRISVSEWIAFSKLSRQWPSAPRLPSFASTAVWSWANSPLKSSNSYHQIADKRLLERFVQKIIAILDQLVMKRIETGAGSPSRCSGARPCVRPSGGAALAKSFFSALSSFSSRPSTACSKLVIRPFRARNSARNLAELLTARLLSILRQRLLRFALSCCIADANSSVILSSIGLFIASRKNLRIAPTNPGMS